MFGDPTYVKAEIEANPEWDVAFVLSELHNDSAPLGWSRFISDAKCLLRTFDIKRRRPTPPTGEPTP